MKVFVIGSGGREHAIAWKLAQSPHLTGLYASPGNPGIASVATIVPAPSSPDGLLSAAQSVQADLTIVGPEAPLVAGVVDRFREAGLKIFGPHADAAQLEGSKIYAKKFFQRLSIPTARFVSVNTTADALDALAAFECPVVVKADGLAAGKGVIIAQTVDEARAAIHQLGPHLVIEECLQGEEISFIAICDGKTAIPLAPSQDHKRVFDGDAGPNTGGMGAYCDPRLLTADQERDIMNQVILPTVEATNFCGFLYAGLMMTAQGPKVLEYNVRLGDPETQPLLHRLQSDLLPILDAAAAGHLDAAPLSWNPGPSVCVVLASKGYPGDYQIGKAITGIAEAEASGAVVFHAGTRQGPQGVETAGGRVLGVTASGPDLPSAIQKVYSAASHIHFDGVHYRKDIGHRGLSRYNG